MHVTLPSPFERSKCDDWTTYISLPLAGSIPCVLSENKEPWPGQVIAEHEWLLSHTEIVCMKSRCCLFTSGERGNGAGRACLCGRDNFAQALWQLSQCACVCMYVCVCAGRGL